MTDRGISTAVDSVLAVSIVAAAIVTLVVLAPQPVAEPPNAGAALDALVVTTATVNTSEGSVRATLGTHLGAAALVPDTPYARAVAARVRVLLASLSGRAGVVVRTAAGRSFAIGPTPARTASVNAAVLPLCDRTWIVLRRWRP